MSLQLQVFPRPTKKDCLILDLTDNCLKHRLEPQDLGKALGRRVIDGETVLESIKREEGEKRERALSGFPLVRRLKDQRSTDLTIDIKARLDWQEHDDGTFVLEIGQEKHRILMVPSAALEGSYEVWAELAPTSVRQSWLADTPLGWAQEYAERQARLLASHEHNVVLVDRHAGRLRLPVEPWGKQAGLSQAVRHSQLGEPHPRRGLRHPGPRVRRTRQGTKAAPGRESGTDSIQEKEREGRGMSTISSRYTFVNEPRKEQ
jgi:hypothetical protein